MIQNFEEKYMRDMESIWNKYIYFFFLVLCFVLSILDFDFGVYVIICVIMMLFVRRLSK